MLIAAQGGVMGIAAGAVQAGHGKSGDTCDMQVNGKVVETLFF